MVGGYYYNLVNRLLVFLRTCCWIFLNLLSNFVWDEVTPQTGTSPTQLRIFQHKRGRDGVTDTTRMSAPPTSSSALLHPLTPSRYSLLFLSPLANLPVSLPVRGRCHGNNTKRFSSALSPWQRLAFLQAVVGISPPSGLLQPTCTDQCQLN